MMIAVMSAGNRLQEAQLVSQDTNGILRLVLALSV